MFMPTRRETLALGAGSLIASLIGPQGRANAAVGDTLTIAYNVNLPAFDPTVGPSAVNPTIQAIYRSVFDQFIGQKPDLKFTPGLLTGWGWSDDRKSIWMDVREGVTWHDGSPFTPEDIVWSLTRAGDAKTGNPIQFVWSTLGNFKIDGKRVTADAKQFDPSLFKWMAFLTGLCAAQGLLHQGRRGGLREEAGRHRALHGRRVSGQRLPAAQGQSEILGRQAGLQHRGVQIHHRRHQPRRRDRERLFGSDAGNSLRGVRPAEEEEGPRRRRHPDFRHRHDLHQLRRRQGADQGRAARRPPCHRQAGDRQAAAARLRRADRHAGGAGIRGLRSDHQGRLRSRRRPSH